MYQIDLKEAEGRLPELIEEAAQGGEVVITRGDGASFKVVPVQEPRPKFGSAKGLVEMSEDFDEPV
jgi:antitoxin (DNA-binding transcriptional repressor) of toxin-antitoxin stability system